MKNTQNTKNIHAYRSGYNAKKVPNKRTCRSKNHFVSFNVSSSMTKVTLEYSENTIKIPEETTRKPKQQFVSISAIRHQVMPAKTIAKTKITTTSVRRKKRGNVQLLKKVRTK